ncbi:MAG: LEA type 2 family protein [Tagaea sp.]|nr:LEA type 2 family protein [Azospirillum sp.]MCA3268624.1 LEA type 2 family protein [Azospirillum sp.]
MIARRALLAAGFAAAFSGGLAGCAGVRLEPLDVRLVDLALVEGGGLLEQRLALTLALSNPNPTDVALDGLRVALDVNGEPLARGQSGEGVVVPRLGEARARVIATVSMLDLLPGVLAMTQREGLAYRLSGTAFVAGLGGGRLAFAREGRLPRGG